MEIKKDYLTFGRVKGSGPQTATKDVALSNQATKVAAVLTGFVAEFSGGNDHHLGKLDVFVDATVLTAMSVRVSARFGLRDWSGTWDDEYDGRIDFAVIAE